MNLSIHLLFHAKNPTFDTMLPDAPSSINQQDQNFLDIISAILLGAGLVMLLLGLSCKVISWSYCSWQLLPVFGRDIRFPEDITSINLPLAMLVIGLGIRLFSPYGWWIITILLMVLLTFFGFLVVFHLENWPFIETANGDWHRMSFLKIPHGDALLTSCLCELILLCSFFYWWTPQVRAFYFEGDHLSSTMQSKQSQ